MSKLEAKVYQIKVTLANSKPPIWRRIRVRSDITFEEFHDTLQIVMGWENCHLHQFIIGVRPFQTLIGINDPEFMDDLDSEDESQVRLADVVIGEGFKFRYEYDFGDGWEHNLEVEKILPVDSTFTYPVCLKGKMACPHEDIGGIWGYESYLEKLNSKSLTEEDKEYLDYFGDFDPEEFDLEYVNTALRAL